MHQGWYYLFCVHVVRGEHTVVLKDVLAKIPEGQALISHAEQTALEHVVIRHSLDK